MKKKTTAALLGALLLAGAAVPAAQANLNDYGYWDYYGAGYDTSYDDDWFYDYYDYGFGNYDPYYDYYSGYDWDDGSFLWEEDGLF